MMPSAYLEDFHLIKMILPNEMWTNDQIWYVKNAHNECELFINNMSCIGNQMHIFLKCTDELLPYIDYEITNKKNVSIKLKLGKITRASLFEKKFTFSGWLGFRYQHQSTTFRVWSPVSKEMYLVLDDEKYQMEISKQGVWSLTIHKDCDRCRYHFLFRINEEWVETLDPYGISSKANNEENYVIDFNKTYQMKQGYFYKENFQKNDAIIYELSVRDATSSLDVEEKGTFQTLSNSKNEAYGLGKIKKLGITHLQLLPIFTFGGVDENIKDNTNPNFLYNWGYNPMQYFVPSGFYVANPDDPYARINAFKELVDTIHDAGLALNMDVVYNHVYDNTWFPQEKLVPGYTFRTDERGFLTDSSWCGNDLKTDHTMIRKLIVDSIQHFQKKYLVDGFRFDLMGLIDTKTIQLIEKKTSQNNPLTMLYGEGWNMEVAIEKENRANMLNCEKMPNVSFFNDYFRNTVKQLVSGMDIRKEDVLNLIRGNTTYYKTLVSSNQSINYVECHDNETLYDLLVLKGYPKNQIKYYTLLAFGLIIFSEGIPFIHAGMEYFRTKKGSHNSYNSGDEINRIDWFNENNLEDSIKDMIEIRKTFLHFHLSEQLMDLIRLDGSSTLPTIRIIDWIDSSIQIVVKSNFEEETKYFAPYTTMIFNGVRKTFEDVDKYDFHKPGVYVFIKKV